MTEDKLLNLQYWENNYLYRKHKLFNKEFNFATNSIMAKIIFNFEDKNIPQKIVENVSSGYSILEITEDHDVHLNHNCGGVCACSTCHIYVKSGDQYLEEISDKEEDFIDRAINPRLESRLACQCIILDDQAIVEVILPDQSNIIGHEH
jgi:2Fe-2S ferredoxin